MKKPIGRSERKNKWGRGKSKKEANIRKNNERKYNKGKVKSPLRRVKRKDVSIKKKKKGNVEGLVWGEGCGKELKTGYEGAKELAQSNSSNPGGEKSRKGYNKPGARERGIRLPRRFLDGKRTTLALGKRRETPGARKEGWVDKGSKSWVF